MEVFYINIEEFKKKYSKDFLTQYADIEIKNEKRFYEYTLGRYLVKNIAKNRYDIDDTEIIVNQYGKPEFKNAKLHFNISHSKNIVIACFDKYNCAIDIEYIKKRDLEKFSNYFNSKFNTLDEFYEFWTLKEAMYKLGDTLKSQYTTKFQDKYYLSIVSGIKLSDVKIKNIF